jgi:hypothetical protein
MKPIELELLDKHDVRRMSAVQQARLGIQVIRSEDTVVLKCATCGRSWSPELSASGHISTRDLVCPQRCNL